MITISVPSAARLCSLTVLASGSALGQAVYGAIFGTKPAEGFYVRIDEALNPASERMAGKLHIEIGVMPVYPAEFVIVRIGIWDGGSDVAEA